MPDEDFDDIFQPRLSRSDVRDEIQKTLRDIAVFNAQAVAGQQNAIREVSATHADFEQRRPQMQATLEQIPLLRDAIGAAEANPSLAPTLTSLYEIVYRASAPMGSNGTTAASEPSLESQVVSETDFSSEDVQYRAALASQRIDLSPENRKTIISNLEQRGVLDLEF